METHKFLLKMNNLDRNIEWTTDFNSDRLKNQHRTYF